MQSNTFKILKDIDPKQFFPNSKHIILYAFTIGERHYFRYDDALNTPYSRALQCLVYYKELDMNIDRTLIAAHCQAFDNKLSGSKFTTSDLLELKLLNDQLKQRLNLPKEPDLMYKLASVVFFDQHENPEIYEFKYGERKIKGWKKEVTLEGFFLQRPLIELIPYLTFAGENLKQYSQMTKDVTTIHLENLLPMLSDQQRTQLRDR